MQNETKEMNLVTEKMAKDWGSTRFGVGKKVTFFAEKEVKKMKAKYHRRGFEEGFEQAMGIVKTMYDETSGRNVSVRVNANRTLLRVLLSRLQSKKEK